ncbi:ESX secretion-associated protein EspG [Nocardia colli]|uniref:ESX secretion-associated protein EspG n=1 Tax=Nocardia colli TaxID=2545717 RepID=UPI00168CE6BF|nr:ESX secretion-associated protein EspG [Nocardia colli]
METQTVWTFTPDEFAWVWTETGLDEYPEPLSIIESTTTQDEYAQLVAEISARYPRGGDPDLTGPLQVLAHPDLRIICRGRSHNSHKRVRSLGAAVGELGVILFQKSGTTADFGGDIKLVVTRRSQLPRHIAATMPPASGGAAERMLGYTPRVRGDEPPSSWHRAPDGEHAVEERIRSLLRLRRNAEGHFRIERVGVGGRPRPPLYLSWIDVQTGQPEAGRYIISVTDNDTTVMPASADVVARELSHRAALDHA